MKRYDDEDMKKNNIPLKAFSIQHDNDECEEEDDKEMTLLTRRSRMFGNSKRSYKKNFKRVKKELSKREKEECQQKGFNYML